MLASVTSVSSHDLNIVWTPEIGHHRYHRKSQILKISVENRFEFKFQISEHQLISPVNRSILRPKNGKPSPSSSSSNFAKQQLHAPGPDLAPPAPLRHAGHARGAAPLPPLNRSKLKNKAEASVHAYAGAALPYPERQEAGPPRFLHAKTALHFLHVSNSRNLFDCTKEENRSFHCGKRVIQEAGRKRH
jgi:hypothetical protein